MVGKYTGGIDPIDVNINNDQYCRIREIHQATMLKTASMPGGLIAYHYPPPAATNKPISMKNKELLACRYKIVKIKSVKDKCWYSCAFTPSAIGWSCTDVFDNMKITKQDLFKYVGKPTQQECYKRRNKVDRFLRTCWYYITHIN